MTDESKQPFIVWWIIWAALLTGVFVIYRFPGETVSQSQPASPDSSAWLVGLVPFVIGTVIRWLVLPRAQSTGVAFTMFVAGMALAEATCILGIFVFPLHKQELFVLGALGIAQFIPLFARRYCN